MIPFELIQYTAWTVDYDPYILIYLNSYTWESIIIQGHVLNRVRAVSELHLLTRFNYHRFFRQPPLD